MILALGTLVLVGVTAYYAWQNHNMVGVLKRQADLTEKIESHGRADTQIMAAVLLKVDGVADLRKSPGSISETPQADEPRTGRTSLAA